MLVNACRSTHVEVIPDISETEGDSRDPVLIFAWEDYLRAEEIDAIAVMGYAPDTVLVAGEGRSLLYRGTEAHLFQFSNGLLDAESHMNYVEGREAVQAAYDSILVHWHKAHGPPSLEIDTGAMWIYTPGTATDSLAALVDRIGEAAGLPPDSLTMGTVFDRASNEERTELLHLLNRHRAQRIYVQPLFGTNVYSVTRTREAGGRALWDHEGNLRTLGSLRERR